MAATLNKVFLMGNLTRDPELKYTPQGTAIVKFGIAVNRHIKSSDGELKKMTDFFNIVVWGKTGENCNKFLTKGRPVHIEGRLQTRSYETQDGQKRTVTDVVAENVQFLGGANTQSEAKSGGPVEESGESSQNNESTDSFSSDDVPF